MYSNGFSKLKTALAVVVLSAISFTVWSSSASAERLNLESPITIKRTAYGHHLVNNLDELEAMRAAAIQFRQVNRLATSYDKNLVSELDKAIAEAKSQNAVTAFGNFFIQLEFDYEARVSYIETSGLEIGRLELYLEALRSQAPNNAQVIDKLENELREVKAHLVEARQRIASQEAASLAEARLAEARQAAARQAVARQGVAQRGAVRPPAGF